jgi:hypothetical protein
MDDLLAALQRRRRETHANMLRVARGLSDEQLRHSAGAHSQSIGFHLWHVARWNDFDRESLGGGPQLWVAQSLAQRWGVPELTAGEHGTGTGMTDEAAATLTWPNSDALLDYIAAANAAFADMFDRLTLADFLRLGHPLDDVVMAQAHDERHLGMIEALRGVAGISGTATN